MRLAASPAIKRNKTLREQVLATPRKSVLSGTMTPGEILVEAHISEQLRLSRGP